MSSVDLLEKHANPTEEETREWLVGNLCRCTGYHYIVEAIRQVASNGGR